MKVLVSEKLSEHKYKTPEGYLICTDAILARTGKQSYTKDELFCDGDNTEVNVDRPYDEVMNAKTIASFENKPITFDHPDEDVNVGNYKDYAIGYVRDVRQGKTDKGEDVILGNLVITDQEAINAIEQGDHTDLSCGYDCDIRDDGNGNYSQTNIRGNHLALCEQGRAGIARIVDSKISDKLSYETASSDDNYLDEVEKMIYRFANVRVDTMLVGDKLKIAARNSKGFNSKQLNDIASVLMKNVAVSNITISNPDRFDSNVTAKIVDSKVKDDNLLGKRVRIRKRYSNLDGTIGTIYSYEGTNYDDEVEVKRNGHVYKVNYEDIEFLDSKVEDATKFYIITKYKGQAEICESLDKAMKLKHSSTSMFSGGNVYEVNSNINWYRQTEKTEGQGGVYSDLLSDVRKGIVRIVDSKVKDDETIDYKGIKIGVLHTSIGTLYEVRYNKNKADWPEYKKLENAKKYIDIFLTKGEQAANTSWKIDDTIVDSKARDLVNDSEELVVGKWYDFAKKIKVTRNEYATSLRISGKSGNVYRYTIYLKNGEMYGSGTYSEIKEMYNIKDSKVDSKVEDSLSKKEKELCDYMLENALDDGEDENDLLKKMKLYYSEYSNLARSKPNEVLQYFKSHIDDNKIEDSKEMTMPDAIKMLNIVDIYKRVRDASKNEWVIKNTGLAYEVLNQGKMVKKFPTKKLAIEWIHSRFPTDEITEDSTKDDRLWQTLTRKTKH